MRLDEHVKSFLRRNSQTIPLVVMAICVMGILILQAIQIGKFAESAKKDSEVIMELKKIAEQGKASDELRSRQIDRVDRHLDCIVLFFNERNRAAKSIDEIDSCRISDSDLSTVTIPQGNLETQPTTEQNNASTTDTEGVSGKPSMPQAQQQPATQPAQPAIPIISPLIDTVIKALGGN